MTTSTKIKSRDAITLVVLLFLSPLAFPHGGGVDSNGGHYDRKTATYHCHKEPCFRIHKRSDDALQEAKVEQRNYSLTYSRDDWAHWLDTDDDCLNTRHEILNSQSLIPAKLSKSGCYVSSGQWHDPYSGNVFTNPRDLDVDHVIPLYWAHTHGGANWTKEKKAIFANLPENLIAVDAGLNREKSAKGPDQWLPPNHSYRCTYLAKWQQVLLAYPDLMMTNSEQRIFNRQLTSCGEKPS